MKKKNEKISEVTKTIESTLPFMEIYDNGIFMVKDHFYSKSYEMPDINYDTQERPEQAAIGMKWANLLGSFDSTVSIQVSGVNRQIDMLDYQNNMLMHYYNDDLDFYRDESNEILLETLEKSKNNLETLLFLTLTIPAVDIVDATNKFVEYDKRIEEELGLLTKSQIKAMTTNERINLLYSIYNPDDVLPLIRPRMENGKETTTFSIEQCLMQGTTPASVIGPDSLTFLRNRFEMGNSIGNTYYPSLYPTSMCSDFISSLLKMPCRMLFSCHFRTYEKSEGIKFLKEKNTNIDSNLISKQQKAWQGKYDPTLISPELTQAKTETTKMMEEITTEDAKLFLATMTTVLFADDEEELKRLETGLKQKVGAKGFVFKPLNSFHKLGLNTSLPLGLNELPEELERLMTTSTIVSFTPFCAKRVRDEGGRMYGKNAFTKEPNIVNRKKSGLNLNMLTIGTSGGGKSFASKEEITGTVLDSPNDDVYVVSPTNEYDVIANAYNGSIVRVGVGKNNYINPFDLNIRNINDEDEDPVKLKISFIENVIEKMVHTQWGLTSNQQSIVARCTKNIYEDYIVHCKENNLDMDRDNCPTLRDFYIEVKKQRDPEAKDLAGSLERFLISMDCFSHHTNVDLDNRFVVFNISGIANNNDLKELGLYIMMDYCRNKAAENCKKNKWTWLYFDEFHTILKSKGAAEYAATLWKTSRHIMCLCTGITQNAEDVLTSSDARLIIDNSYIIQILSQAPAAQGVVQKIFNIPSEEMRFISSGKAGRGILQIGEDLIPREGEFPKDTKLYEIMSTKPGEKREWRG